MTEVTETKRKAKKRLDLKLPDEIKEKTYLTKQVDTSITILDSPENDVVLESLLFLSRRGLVNKLLNLLEKNVCILRLSLRLLNVLSTLETVLLELDQEMYDDKILEISNLYKFHNDLYVKEFCVAILSKLASSCRIGSLIFGVDLLKPVLATIKTTKSLSLLESTLVFFYEIINTPAVLSSLIEVEKFDIPIITNQLNHSNDSIVELALKIICRLTSFSLDVFQRMFRQSKLVEKMMLLIMNPEKKKFHNVALEIIQNCMNSSETSTYFIESLEFLDFCQWVKTCDHEYLLPCVDIFEKLSKIPQIKQTLFDLSVENSILLFLRSQDKVILNKTCEAISNMGMHKYCCEHMLTPMVMKTIIEILERKDEVDPENEVALKTISDFMNRSLKTIDILHSLKSHQIILEYFTKGNKLSDESQIRVLEILYKFSVHPRYQKSIVNDKFFGKLLKLLESGPDGLTIIATEILTYFVGSPDFVALFLSLKGPSIVLTKLNTTTNMKVLKNLLVFIHCILTEESLMMWFLRQNVVSTLEQLPSAVRSRETLIDTILVSIYNLHLPLKFFQRNRLEITDKLKNKFYLINGHWTSPFPFLEILEAMKISTIMTIYVVDYTYQYKTVFTENDKKIPSETNLRKRDTDSKVSSEQSKMDSDKEKMSRKDSEESTTSARLYTSPFDINHGKLSPDPYFPKYLHHIAKFLAEEAALENRIRILAEYVDTLLCGPSENLSIPEKLHQFQLHIATLKQKLGTNMIPIGFLRIGFHCERALLFKAMADRSYIPCSLVKGGKKLYWNEVALFDSQSNEATLKLYIVDLMNNIGNLLMVGSREANQYCS
ncbi:hypothetical protein JTB14_032725 [Gonioctena quinquepunctata]|nr:hypothetical protein JTB14_032725 [Gonioctena quinquepunctata]